jgi:hypothetical protein
VFGSAGMLALCHRPAAGANLTDRFVAKASPPPGPCGEAAMPPGDEHPLFAGDAKPATGLTCGGGGVLGGIGVKPPLKPAADCFPGVFNPALTPVGAAMGGVAAGAGGNDRVCSCTPASACIGVGCNHLRMLYWPAEMCGHRERSGAVRAMLGGA